MSDPVPENPPTDNEHIATPGGPIVLWMVSSCANCGRRIRQPEPDATWRHVDLKSILCGRSVPEPETES
jgi:hypothetical protein